MGIQIYFISGLGADRRAFDKIKLDDEYVIHFIDWLEPEKHEALEHYARRMAESIDQHQPFVLVGLSFGGLMAIEISKLVHAEKLILISSISNRSQLPPYYKFIGKLGLQRSPVIHLLKNKSGILHWFFGTKSKRLKEYLNEMIEGTSINYLAWSLDQIVHWKQTIKPQHVVHIHGGNDKLFPIRFIEADRVIDRAGHFMVVTHAKEVSQFIVDSIKAL